MSERKVLNKYYPPDFDPSKLSKSSSAGKKNVQQSRIMLPMSVQCERCGEYIYRGKKFNGRKDEVKGERYLGTIRIWRLSFRCPSCLNTIAIRTDPANSDYVVESGAKKTFGLEKGRIIGAAVDDSKDDEKDDMTRLTETSAAMMAQLSADDAVDELIELSNRAEAIGGEEAALTAIRDKANDGDQQDRIAARERFEAANARRRLMATTPLVSAVHKRARTLPMNGRLSFDAPQNEQRTGRGDKNEVDDIDDDDERLLDDSVIAARAKLRALKQTQSASQSEQEMKTESVPPLSSLLVRKRKSTDAFTDEVSTRTKLQRSGRSDSTTTTTALSSTSASNKAATASVLLGLSEYDSDDET